MAEGDVDRAQLDRYHASRSVAHQPFRSACYAPFVGLSFDAQGGVSVCAFTRSTPLGRVGDRPLLDMWNGPVVERLRSAVVADDLTHACTRCAEEIAGGNLHSAFARGFDQFAADRDHPWPRRMEFALSNACDLQCVMCSGEFSSAIRSRREGLPPLASRYGDAFLEELAPFLPHLEQARFLGGEPFLAPINHRIWDALAELGRATDCNVTTNGMHWNDRIEAHLERLPFSVGISLDGVTAATVESIRVGASHRRLMENLDRFLAYRDRTGNSVSLTFCLMRQNWHEFGDYLVFAEERGCQVYVNTVRQPPANSLFRLPPAELRAVVAALEAAREPVASRLSRNREVWFEQLDRLAAHLRDLEAGGDHLAVAEERLPLPSADVVAALVADGPDEPLVTRRLAELGGEVSVVRCDAEDRIVEADRYLGEDVTDLVGSPAGALFSRAAARLGHRIDILAADVSPGVLARVLVYDDPGRPASAVASVTLRGPEPWASTRLHAVLPALPAAPVAVRLGVSGP